MDINKYGFIYGYVYFHILVQNRLISLILAEFINMTNSGIWKNSLAGRPSNKFYPGYYILKRQN